MKTFIILYFCNLVLDYPLQDDFLKKYKCEYNYFLFVHCAIWALGLSIVLMPLNLFAWWKVFMLLAGHYAIDYWKCRRLYKKWWGMKDMTSLYIDQTLHIAQVALCLI